MSDDQLCKIFVGNVAAEADQPELREHFKGYGVITNVHVLKGFAFITFKSEDDAMAAIQGENGVMFMGKKIDVKPATRKPKVGQQQQQQQQKPHQDQGSQRGRGGGRGGRGGRGGGGGGFGFEKYGWSGGGSDKNQQYDQYPQGRGGGGHDGYHGGRGEPMDEDYHRGGPPQQRQPPQNFPPPQQQQQQQQQHPGSQGAWNPSQPVNDCEIVCVNKMQRYFAESIEARLKNIGMDVDVLFPNPDIPLAKIFGNITSRGVGYAILITPLNEEHRSVTLNVLQGQQQEHRNMPMEDAISLLAKNFARTVENKTKSGGVGDRHPEDIVTVLSIFADNRPLSIMEYDKLIKYLAEKRSGLLKLEYGENIPSNLATPPIGPQMDPAVKAKQEELQSKIMGILNKPKSASVLSGGLGLNSGPSMGAVSAAPGASSSFFSSSIQSGANNSGVGAPPPPAGIDPSLQKAIDSLIKTGPNLLSQVGGGSFGASSQSGSGYQGGYGGGNSGGYGGGGGGSGGGGQYSFQGGY